MRMCGLAVVAFVLVGCAREAPSSPRDPLELIVGGEGDNLREALALAAQPRQSQRVQSPVNPEPQPNAPVPTPPPRTVALESGMTLYGIARAHLPGRPEDGVRRILEVNGWSEAQARRLPAGTTVRLP